MFSLYKTIHPPTGIENAVYCNFINSKDLNLITSSANRLQVFRLNSDLNSTTDNSNKNQRKLKFECVESFTLFGNISSIASCRYGNMNKDALIVAFMDAKLSIIEYNTAIGDLNTLSIHYFEDEIEPEGFHFNTHYPIVRVDPDMRCAVMLIYGFKLVVIPFHDDNENSSNNTNHVNIANANNLNLLINNDSTQSGGKLNQTSGAGASSASSLSSYIIDLRKLDNWLSMRIVDIQFLFGYYEPTLFILCESNRTWVGRYAVKKDTCNSISLSLNLNQKTNPLIWPVDKLPSDCIKCLPVPQPIGGVLLFSVNCLIYINQSVPSYGVSLNSLAKNTTKYPLKSMDHMKISLDCSHACFIASDRLILSLKGGEIYIITLITDSDSLRTVRCFNIEKGPGSVIASCITCCCDNYLFIGSRLGNSVLLKYTAKSLNDDNSLPTNTNMKRGHEDSSSRLFDSSKRLCTEDLHLNDKIDDDLGKILYMTNDNNNDENLNANIISYQFEICDILLNVAPCGHSIIGESIGEYTDFNSNPFQTIDLVTTSGHSKNGAVCVLQRSLRPEVLTSFQIDNIIDMWSVSSSSLAIINQDDDTDINLSDTSTYLFISKDDSTMILQMGSEITELDKNVFCTKQPTICVSNIGGPNSNKYIVQITNTDLYVYNVDQLMFTYNFSADIDSTVKIACVEDPYIVFMTESGLIVVYSIIENNEYNTKPTTSATASYDYFRVTKFVDFSNELPLKNAQSFSLYKQSGNDDLFKLKKFDQATVNKLKIITEEKLREDNSTVKNRIDAFEEKLKMNLDNEDELLYGNDEEDVNSNAGDDGDAVKDENQIENEQQQQPSMDVDQEKCESEQIKELDTSNYWLFVVTHDGTLCIYNLNGDIDENNENIKLNLVYTVPKFVMAPKTLQHSQIIPSMLINTPVSIQRTSSLAADNQYQPNVYELFMMTIGSKSYLISRVDDEIVIYEAFSYDDDNLDINTLKIRFKRLTHEIIIRDKRKRVKAQLKKPTGGLSNIEQSVISENAESIAQTRTKHVPILRRFENIAGYEGFFINGLRPYFVFLCPRSGLTVHPLWIDGPINSFVSLKNASITLSGFIYTNKKNDIRICTLPVDRGGKLQIYYDSPWTLVKVQLRQTVHFVTYHEESKTYACVVSVSETTKQLMQLGGEDKELETYERDENCLLPTRELFTIQLYTPDTWEPLPLGKYQLGEWEHVTSFKLVRLPYEGHSSGYRAYIAASTSNCYNEDVNSRGRVIIFDVIDVEPEPGQPLTRLKMKNILDKEQKGPVTCIESVNGHLVGAVGQKVFLWEYRNGELIGRAFLDTHFYIHKMITLKCFILIADISRSISLIRIQEEFKKLSFVAKDKHYVETYGCEFLVENTNLAFIATDSEKNLSVYAYSNESHDNQGGEWLIRKAEFNIGSHINSMFRIKCNVLDPNLDKRSVLADKRQVTYCTTLDGSIGYLIPLIEKTFRRLFMLQNALTIMIPHYAALNPKAFRSMKSKRKELCNPQKNILDGDLLFKYFDLSYNDRNDISKKIKTSIDQILDDLVEVYQFTQHF